MSRLRFAPLSLFASQAEFWKIPKKLFGLTSFSDCTICFAQSSGITKMRPTLRAMSGMPERMSTSYADQKREDTDASGLISIFQPSIM